MSEEIMSDTRNLWVGCRCIEPECRQSYAAANSNLTAAEEWVRRLLRLPRLVVPFYLKKRGEPEGAG